MNAAQQFAVSVKTSLYRQDVMGKELKNEVIVTMDEQLTDHLIRGVKYYDSFTDDFGYSWILSRAPLECSLDVAESLLLSYLFEMKQNPEQGRRIMDSTERDFLERRKETAQMSIEDMVLIRGGTYRSALTGDNTELESFLVSSHETTQGEWALVMEPLPEGLDYGRGDEFPVYNVSWDESVEFCNRLSIRDGLTPCYVKDGDEYQCFFQADGYRLPTAIEWEFAAFAKAASTGWSSENSGGAVHRVGSMSGEFNQLHDMAGNVWEWCWEWYDEDETMRIIKGGGWNSPNRDLSFMESGRVYPDEADPSVGFRVVRSLR